MSAQSTADLPLALRAARVEDIAEGVRLFDLVRTDGGELPAFTPGSHLTVLTPSGALRKYSICSAPGELQHYQIAVKCETQGRGGSLSMHRQVRQGEVLRTSLPDNAFVLVEAPRYVFIAGGIGITPILSMIRSLSEIPAASWKLYYLTRSAATTAFLDQLTAPEFKAKVKLHHDEGEPSRAFDLWPVLEKPLPSTQVYCCGPQPLMDAVRDMTGHWSARNIHFESFVEGGQPRADDQPFFVRLARSGSRLEVPVGETILGVVREHGCAVPSSCESGTCGTCRTTLLEGQADHRDMVLLPDEQARQIMICVSRAKSSELVLDL